MSHMGERLEDLASGGASGAASRLASEERIEALSGRVAAGRRRRGAAGAAGLVAAVAVLAVGVWTVLPGTARAAWDPASPSDVAFDYSLDDYGDATIVPAEIDTMDGGDPYLLCGQEFTLEAGVTIHDAEATTSGARIAQELVPLVSDEADPDDNDDRVAWQGVWGGRSVSWNTVSLLVADGVIVGLGGESTNNGDESGYVSGGSKNYEPALTTCPDGVADAEQADAVVPILVAQAYLEPLLGRDLSEEESLSEEEWFALSEEQTLLATVVFDPRYSQEESQAAGLTAPSEGVFQAFAVDAPEMSCNALGSVRTAGEPEAATVSSFLDLGDEVATIGRVLDTQAPFADVASGSWMAGADAWLVVDSADGASMVHLDWRTDGDGHEVLEVGDQSEDPLRPAGCDLPDAFTGSGAAFLVVDAVAPGLEMYGSVWGESTEGAQTWIYLGDD